MNTALILEPKSTDAAMAVCTYDPSIIAEADACKWVAAYLDKIVENLPEDIDGWYDAGEFVDAADYPAGIVKIECPTYW